MTNMTSRNKEELQEHAISIVDHDQKMSKFRATGAFPKVNTRINSSICHVDPSNTLTQYLSKQYELMSFRKTPKLQDLKDPKSSRKDLKEHDGKLKKTHFKCVSQRMSIRKRPKQSPVQDFGVIFKPKVRNETDQDQ